ncbi:S8 family serine peptidase, partial [Clostridiaceae bacterium HSG29]|nr:S8 family serine peptidase [Clostridiaceae bacterium HSG29]
MKKYLLLIILLFMFLFSTISFAKSNGEKLNLEEIQKNYILVKYKNGKIEKRLISDFVEPKMKSMSLDLNNESDENNKTEIEEAIEIANENDEIEFSEPIIIFTADDTLPNDINENDAWRFDLLGMNDLWEDFDSVDFSEITVALIDTGIDMDNPDFNIDTANAYDFVNADNNPNDDHGHGSHVAGILGAISNNNNDVAGIASEVKLLPLKVLDAGGSGTNENVALAIKYAAGEGEDKRADIINMSLGANIESDVVREAVEYAYSKGVIIVSSSGNGSNHWIDSEDGDEDGGTTRDMSTMGYPAAFNEVISVGSIQYLNNEIYISDFSECSGDQIINGILQNVYLDVVAPGSRIYSYISDGRILSLSGTSMASPHVAGLAAILKAKYTSLDNIQIREIINKTAIDNDIIVPSYSGVSDDEIYGNGLINIKNAFGFDGLKELEIKAYDSLNNELSISGYNFDQFDYSYNIEVPESTVKIVFNGSTVMSNSNVLNNEDSIPNVLLTKLIDSENTLVEISVETNYGNSINQLYEFNIAKKISNSFLENLIITDYDLSPVFNKDTLTYSISNVSYNTETLEINVTKANETDVVLVKVNDGLFADISQTISLDVGENIIYIKVHPENDELDFRIYSISVARNEPAILNDLNVTDHIFLEEFEKDNLIYNISDVNFEIEKIEVLATKANETDTISMSLNNGAYINNETQNISLEVGENIINVKVKNGEETKIYSILITRLAEGVHLDNLIVTNHLLSPEFNKNHMNYSISDVANNIKNLEIIGTKAEIDDEISIKINNGDYIIGDTNNILLDDGVNTISIKV